MGENNNQQTPTVVNTVLAKTGLLISAIQNILQDKNSDKDLFFQLGYKFDNETISELNNIKDDIIETAQGIEVLVRNLMGIDYSAALDDISDFNISSNLKEEGINLFKTGKDLVETSIALFKAIKSFSDGDKTQRLRAFFENDNLHQEFVQRLCDHVLISVFRKIEADKRLFASPNGNTSGSAASNTGFKNSTFARSIKIITASLDLLCIIDTEEVEVIYQDQSEASGKTEIVKLNVMHWGLIEELIDDPVPTLKIMYPWDEISSAKKLFNNFKKLFLAISNNKYSEYFTPAKWLKMLKGWIQEYISKEGDTNGKGQKAIKNINKVLDAVKDTKDSLIGKINESNSNTAGTETPSFDFNENNLNFFFKNQEIDFYFIQPINKVLKNYGINEEIKNIKSTVVILKENILAHSRNRIKEVKKKELSDWGKFIYKAYNEDKIKIDTDDFDFLETIESIIELCMDEIVQVDKIKQLIKQALTDILDSVQELTNKTIQKKQLVQQLMIEIAGRVIQNLIIPQLAPAVEKFKPYVKEIIDIVLQLKEVYKFVNNAIKEFNNLKITDTKGKILSGLKICINLLAIIPKEISDKIPALKAFKAIKDKLPAVKIDPDSQLLSIQLYTISSDGRNLSTALNMMLLTEESKKPALVIYPKITGNLDEEVSIGDDHKLKISLKGELNSTDKTKIIGIKFTKDDVVFESNGNAVAASILLEFLRTKSLELYNSDFLDINISNYPQSFKAGYKASSFDLEYSSKLQGLEFILKKKFFEDKVWSFIADFIDDDIKFSVDTTMSYSLKNGFKFAGSPKLSASFDFKKSFSGIEIDGLNLDIGGNIFDLSKLKTALSTNLALDIAGVGLAVKDMGIEVDMDISGSFKPSAFDLGFKYPTGLGIAIDNEAVKGAGFISYDKEDKRFIGALEINILQKVDLGAYVIFDSSLPEEQGGFAFMALLMASGFVIPLGFNFYLTGIGGALGLNRRINEKAVQNGVYDGTIETAFLAEDLQKNMGQIEKITDNYFPIKKHQFFFGVIAKIDFNQPALVSGEIGLFFQFPSPFQIIIFGGMHIKLPEKGEVKAVVLNLYFAGGVDFTKGLWFDASLRDSKIGFLDIYGDLSLRIAWGEAKGFAITAGGFHPAYTPPPELNLPQKMRRLGIKLGDSIVKLKFETYFALTTNTVQFGAALNISADIKVVSIDGHLSFDALFIFSPFSFIVDVRAGVRVKVFSITLCSVGLEFVLSGTTPWRAKGKAHFKIFLLGSFSPSFNKTWGKSGEEIAPQEEDIFPILSEEYQREKNWSVKAPDLNNAVVKLIDIPNNKVLLHPFGEIVFTQEKLPLNQHLDSYGRKIPGDYNKFKVDSVKLGQETLKNPTPEMSIFIPADFKKMTNEQKLAAPSFEDMQGGFRAASQQKKECENIQVNLEYEHECDDVILSGAGGDKTFTVSDKENGVKSYNADTSSNIGEGTLSVYNSLADNGGFEAGSDAVFAKNIRKKQKEQKITFKTKEEKYRIYNKSKRRFEGQSGSFVDAVNHIQRSRTSASKYTILLEKTK